MATKKAKREAAMAKREQFLADEKTRGLAAQESGRRSDAEERKRMSELARKVNIRHQETLARIATAVEKKQIEQELAALPTRPDGKLTLKARRKLRNDPEASAVLFENGMRV